MAKWWLALASVATDAQAAHISQKYHSSCKYSLRFWFLLMTFLQRVGTLIQTFPYRHILVLPQLNIQCYAAKPSD